MRVATRWWASVRALAGGAILAACLGGGVVVGQAPSQLQPQPAPIRVEAGVTYAHVDGVTLRADIYHPAGTSAVPRPAVLLLHGGGWRAGSRTNPLLLAAGRALAEAGFVAVSVDYRLLEPTDTPGVFRYQHPAALEDCHRAIAFLRREAGRLGIDPNRLGAIGETAGGHLAALLGTQPAEGTAKPAIRAVVSCSGPMDLTEDFSRVRYGDGTAQDLINGFLGSEDSDRKRAASPISHVTADDAAFLLVHGTDDPLVPLDQARRMDAALHRAGVSSRVIALEGGGHGLAEADRPRVLAEVVRFLVQELNLERSESDTPPAEPPSR